MTTPTPFMSLVHLTRAAVRAKIAHDTLRHTARLMQIDLYESAADGAAVYPADLYPYEYMHYAADNAAQAYKHALYAATRKVLPEFTGEPDTPYNDDCARLQSLTEHAAAYAMHKRYPDSHGKPPSRKDIAWWAYEARHDT